MALCAAFSINAVLKFISPFNFTGALKMTGTYAASFLPWILIPLTCWVLPVVTMGLLFIYIESEA
jgi:photosystem I subunit 8